MPAQSQSLNVDYGSLQSLPVHLNTTQHVQVARSKFMPCPTLEGQLAANINPLELSHDFGRALYTATYGIVGQHIQTSLSCNCELVD